MWVKLFLLLVFTRNILPNEYDVFISVRLQVLQEELEAQRARARGESTEAWGVNRTDEDKDVVRATQAQMNYADRPTGGKNRFTRLRRRTHMRSTTTSFGPSHPNTHTHTHTPCGGCNDHYILDNKHICRDNTIFQQMRL